jgi:UDP-N-acetylmuramoyl-tripeptide--D-alanyl-D-alanine ligase
MEVAITNLGNIKAEHKIAVLGDMFEMGEQTAFEHHRIANLAVSKDFDLIILIGNAFEKTTIDNISVKKFSDKPAAIEYLKQQNIENTVFLIKGSRGMALEQLVEYIG